MIPIKDLTDVTLAIQDTDNDESYLVMKLSSDESFQAMKVIKWWKLSSDESYLVLKVI